MAPLKLLPFVFLLAFCTIAGAVLVSGPSAIDGNTYDFIVVGVSTVFVPIR